jgi:CBS domain-containing protein
LFQDENVIIENRTNGLLFHADINESVQRIAHLLSFYKGDAVIVRNNGIPAGIITSGDIIKAISSSNGDLSSIVAENIMTSPIISMDHDKYVDEVKAFMLDQGIIKLPIKKEFDIIGLVVEPDILINSSLYK